MKLLWIGIAALSAVLFTASNGWAQHGHGSGHGSGHDHGSRHGYGPSHGYGYHGHGDSHSRGRVDFYMGPRVVPPMVVAPRVYYPRPVYAPPMYVAPPCYHHPVPVQPYGGFYYRRPGISIGLGW